MLHKLIPSVLIVAFLTAANTLAVNAQQSRMQQVQQWAQQPQILNRQHTARVEGTPYYNEDWGMGYVIIDEQTKSDTMPLRYSSLTNELLFQRNGKTMTLPPAKFNGFVITESGNNVVFRNGFSSSDEKIASEQLLRVIYDGNLVLAAKESTEKITNKNPFSGDVEHKFINRTKYYLIDRSGTFYNIDLKLDDLADALSANRKQLHAFAQKHELSFDSEKDVALILSQYEQSESESN